MAREPAETGGPKAAMRPGRRIAAALTLARNPRRTGFVLWSWIAGRRLRARQALAALIGIDHRLTLPPGILDRFPVAPPVPDADIRVLTAPGHALVADAHETFAAAFAADPTLHALYGDALVQGTPGGPVLPLLRSAFDPALLMAVDDLGPVLALRRASLPTASLDPSRDIPAMAAAFRIAERFGPAAIGHLPGIVSIWRPWMAEAADAARGREPSREARLAIVRDHLDRTGQAGARLAIDGDGVIAVAHPLPDPPPAVTVIVPTRDRLDLLRPCVASLRGCTDWPEIEILVCDNDSREAGTRAYFQALEGEGAARIVACPGPFNFAAMNNAAAAFARGKLLAFVNNDVEAFEPDWLGRMAREALRPDVGAVGAKLLDGAGRIQHGGIVLGTGGLVTHAHRHFPGDAPGYGARLRATHAVSAVTAACLVVEAAKFRRVGGFDAAHFAVDFNDVDLCLRLSAAGYRTLMVPGAVLHHREAASRSWTPDACARHNREIVELRRRWGPLLAQDPHYHPGFDPDRSTHARLRAGFFADEAALSVRRPSY
ncbi:glycosyltransferase [uncultured Methylobacterium sp.]|uniref:glycosyltransferase n=1 Tax=uncultured Methylobacterium sp. TaxID=157278 RepID=UPI0035CB2CC7